MGAMKPARPAKVDHEWLRDVWGLSRAARAKLAVLVPYCCSLAAVAICTWLAFHLGLNLASSGFLYLVVVVLVAVHWGFWAATATSIVAVACLNYFFVPPLFTFGVSDPENLVALGAFEFTALVTSRLSHRAQVRAAEAIAERHDSERLYQTSRQILLPDKSREPGSFIASRVREVFELRAVVLFDAVSASTYVSGSSPPDAEQRARAAYFVNSDTFDSDSNTWFCPLRLGVRPVGALALCEGKMTSLMATALASLCAIAMERARSFEKECRIEAARQAEQLRTAVLDALAHEFKTPLSIIWTSSSGLLAAGGMSDTQTELVALVDEQARKLNDLASQLLGAAKLDNTEFKPQREPLLLSDLANAAIRSLERQEWRDRFHLHIPVHETSALADGKLITSALGQIVDNAIKYSIPGSPIDIRVEGSEAETVLTVRNQGLAIAPADRERIFERFYRAPGTQHRPGGIGLGLSIVKRIVDAHHGRVWVESAPDSGTLFSIALPTAANKP
jgi:two-component system sensor histidine kinase KdpD